MALAMGDRTAGRGRSGQPPPAPELGWPFGLARLAVAPAQVRIEGHTSLLPGHWATQDPRLPGRAASKAPRHGTNVPVPLAHDGVPLGCHRAEGSITGSAGPHSGCQWPRDSDSEVRLGPAAGGIIYNELALKLHLPLSFLSRQCRSVHEAQVLGRESHSRVRAAE
jgi:hypothetical protein